MGLHSERSNFLRSLHQSCQWVVRQSAGVSLNGVDCTHGGGKVHLVYRKAELGSTCRLGTWKEHNSPIDKGKYKRGG